MTTTQQRGTRPFTTVVGVDFSDLSERAITTALTLAGVAGSGEIHLVHAMSLPEVASELGVVTHDVASQLAAARERMAKLVPADSLLKGTRLTVHVDVGIPQDVVNEVARECGADLIVVGTHGRNGLSRALFGSVAEYVTRHAPCSVLTVRPREPTAEEQIEPPCEDCVKASAEGDHKAGTPGTRCARHSRPHHLHAHTYSEFPEAFGGGWMSLRSPV